MAEIPKAGTYHVDIEVGNAEALAAEIEDIVANAVKRGMIKGFSGIMTDGLRKKRPTVVEADSGDLEQR